MSSCDVWSAKINIAGQSKWESTCIYEQGTNTLPTELDHIKAWLVKMARIGNGQMRLDVINKVQELVMKLKNTNAILPASVF